MTDSEKLDLLLEKVDSIESNLAALKADHEHTKVEVKAIRITLENETNRNIQLIAEGHMNLDRKLDEALKSLHQSMMYYLKVNHLDAELQHVKDHLGIA
ncbi:MAG: hypothetical protein LUE65_07615 [Clostridiales bacterium]|nr:hypothetical protein [Clostridiales bacterium]